MVNRVHASCLAEADRDIPGLFKSGAGRQCAPLLVRATTGQLQSETNASTHRYSDDHHHATVGPRRVPIAGLPALFNARGSQLL